MGVGGAVFQRDRGWHAGLKNKNTGIVWYTDIVRYTGIVRWTTQFFNEAGVQVLPVDGSFQKKSEYQQQQEEQQQELLDEIAMEVDAG